MAFQSKDVVLVNYMFEINWMLYAFPEVENISIFLNSAWIHGLWNDNHSSLYLPPDHDLKIIKTLLFSRVYKAELNFAIYSLILLIIIIMY